MLIIRCIRDIKVSLVQAAIPNVILVILYNMLPHFCISKLYQHSEGGEGRGRNCIGTLDAITVHTCAVYYDRT